VPPGMMYLTNLIGGQNCFPARTNEVKVYSPEG
jgi:hypothetical protein